jgi:translation elongation factor EF-Tu-like GTPase
MVDDGKKLKEIEAEMAKIKELLDMVDSGLLRMERHIHDALLLSVRYVVVKEEGSSPDAGWRETE